MSNINNLEIENAAIGMKNFSGEEVPPYNPKGVRNFCVYFGEKEAAELEAEGWNIKPAKEYEDGEVRPAFLPVMVKFGKFPPKIVLIKGKKKTVLDETNVSTLDYADIENVDLIITPYNWSVSGKSGIKAYLKTMYVTIAEDKFSSKYDYLDEDITPDDVPF